MVKSEVNDDEIIPHHFTQRIYSSCVEGAYEIPMEKKKKRINVAQLKSKNESFLRLISFVPSKNDQKNRKTLLDAFWQSLESCQSKLSHALTPIYAADIEGSFMTESCTTWNLGKLTKNNSIIHQSM